jgi:hypothetical protein
MKEVFRHHTISATLLVFHPIRVEVLIPLDDNYRSFDHTATSH